MKGIVIGLFDNRSRAQTVAQEMAKAGFDRGGIHLASSEFEFKKATAAADLSLGETQYYIREIGRGAVAVTTETSPDQAERAVRILQDHKVKAVDQMRAEGERPRYAESEHEVTIPVIEEELRVGKRMVESGGVRIYSHVTEHPVEEQVHLREERVKVERRPADHIASEREMGVFQEGQIKVTTTTEEPVAAKQPHVVEEIIVSKEVTDRTETVRDTARRADIEVERISGAEGERTSAPARGESAPAAAPPSAYSGRPIPNDLRLLRDLNNYEVAKNEIDPRGWKLTSNDGDEIGKIDGLLVSPSTNRAYFAVVNTGTWLHNKLFAIPLATINFDRRDGKASGPYVKDQFRNAPEYHETDRDYQRIYDYWTRPSGGYAGAAGSGR